MKHNRLLLFSFILLSFALTWGSQSDTADLTTTAETVPESYQIFMPAVIRQTSTAAWPE